MLGLVAVLDACVLYPASLRDFLMRLATARLYAARWSDDIHAEWTRNLLVNRPDISPDQLARTQRLMNAALPQARVTGYEERIDSLTLPDLGDRHVLAAAVESQASVIVTFNLKHFPATYLAAYGLTAIHPDRFALQLHQATPHDFIAACRIHRASLTRPAKSASEYLDALEHGQLAETSKALRRHFSEI